MNKVDALFIPFKPWLFICNAAERSFLNILKESSSQFDIGNSVFKVDCRRARCLDGLYDELASAMSFPQYFGRNYNALDECLNDLGWLSCKCYILLFAESHELLVEEDESAFTGLIETIQRAAIEWSTPIKGPAVNKRSAVPFHAVFLENAKGLSHVEARFMRSGFSVDTITAGCAG